MVSTLFLRVVASSVPVVCLCLLVFVRFLYSTLVIHPNFIYSFFFKEEIHVFTEQYDKFSKSFTTLKVEEHCAQ